MMANLGTSSSLSDKPDTAAIKVASLRGAQDPGARDERLMALLLALGRLVDVVGPFCISEQDGRLIYANEAYIRLLPALGSTGENDVSPDGTDMAPYVAEIVASAPRLEGGWSDWIEREHSVPCGAALETYVSHHSILFNGEEQVVLVVGRYLRLDQESEIQHRLAMMRERSEDIARMVSDWIWETDRDLRLTFVSHRVLESSGHHPRGLIGRPLSSLFLPPCPELEKLAREDRRQPFRDLEVRGAHPQAGERHYLLSGVPIFDPCCGTFRGFRGTARDVTDLDARETALRRSKEVAEGANHAKSQFLASVSHELRTPLNAIIGFSEILKSEIFGELGNQVYREYAGDIYNSALHLLDLINDILDVSKIEAGKLELDERQIDPVGVAQAAMRLLEGRADEGQIALSADLPEGLPELQADPRALKQMLLNLLSNAVKFTPQGGKVELAARVDDEGRYLLQVRDDGIGMSEREVVTALTPFGQVDSSFTRRFPGTGLGLPLARGLVELHGGTMEIVSSPSQGTTVTLRFPDWRVVRC